MPISVKYLDLTNGMTVRVNARGKIDQISRMTTGMWTATAGLNTDGVSVTLNVNGTAYPIDPECQVSATSFVPGT